MTKRKIADFERKILPQHKGKKIVITNWGEIYSTLHKNYSDFDSAKDMIDEFNKEDYPKQYDSITLLGCYTITDIDGNVPVYLAKLNRTGKRFFIGADGVGQYHE